MIIFIVHCIVHCIVTRTYFICILHSIVRINNWIEFVPEHNHPAKVSFHQPGPWTGQRTPSYVRLSRWGMTGVANFIPRFRCCPSVYLSPHFGSAELVEIIVILHIPDQSLLHKFRERPLWQVDWNRAQPRRLGNWEFESSKRFRTHNDISFTGRTKLQTTSQAQQRVVRQSY